MTAHVSFGYWVRRRRMALDFTQAELAQRVGCAPVTIGKIERDERRPSQQMATLLAEHLAIPETEREAFLQMARGEFVSAAARPLPTPAAPSFLDRQEKAEEEPFFVARERELSELDAHLQETLQGNGRVVFVTGEAGRGKTTLLAEFARQVQDQNPSLVVASGACNAFAGSGDPYLPFRDVLGALAGDLEGLWSAGTITTENARRLWHLAPFTVRTILDEGQELIDVFVSRAILTKTLTAANPGDSSQRQQLRDLVERAGNRPRNLEQSQLLEQYVRALQALAARQPLLLLLDDLQWADGASISLLFHLGRRLAGHRILVIGSYRISEVALALPALPSERHQQHPLETVINELKRQFGHIQIDLSRHAPDEERAFVDAILDSEPNRLGEAFRGALLARTKGHPLFTIELLRDMQERGDLIQDESGHWIESPGLFWQALPARVEAVIAQRLGRLDQSLWEILTIASVEGEQFTAQIVARIQQTPERPLFRQLSQELIKRHRLVREREELQIGSRHVSRYQFSHALFQQYLYNTLSSGERRLLHHEVAQGLEELYAGHTQEIIMELAHHYVQAGEQEKAILYSRDAARRAEAMYAYDEAIRHLNTALSLIEPGLRPDERLAMLEQLADLHVLHGERPQAVIIYQQAIGLWRSMLAQNKMTLVRLQRKIGEAIIFMIWFADKQQFEEIGRASLQAGLELLAGEPPHVERVRILALLSQDAWLARTPPDWDAAERYAQAAVSEADDLDSPIELSIALDALAKAYGGRNLLRERVEVSLRRLALSRDPRFSSVQEQASTLLQTGFAYLQVGEYLAAIPYLVEAANISHEIQALDLQIRALRHQSACWFWLDRWDRVLEIDHEWRALESSQPNFAERAGPTCYLVALSASVHALRGDLEQARALRATSVDYMVAIDGPQSGWERNNLY